jgi:hypothetical protein
MVSMSRISPSEDDVGVLAQRTLEPRRERRAVDADLALRDDRLLVTVQVLDRVLDGDHVARRRAIDLVDHGGERRRLAAARCAGHEDEPAAPARCAPRWAAG